MNIFLKTKWFTISISWVISFIFFSCDTNQKHEDYKLFDFDSLLQNQVKQLVETKAALQKQVQIQDTLENITLERLDSQRWMNELEVFQQLSQINKPVNRTNYSITESDDYQSNLTVRSFHSSDEIPFQDIKIYYLDALANIKKIEVTVNQQNSIYKSTRVLTLNFSEVYNKHMLTSYSIEGGQQIIMADTVQFNIRGFITIQ